MNANAILEQIEAEARAASQEILDTARQNAQALRKASEERMEKQRADMLDRAARDGDEAEQRMHRMAGLEQRKEQLAAKRQVIDETFQAALKKMMEMPASKARAYLLGLVVKNARGDELLVPGQEHADWLDGEFLTDANKALEAAGKQGNLTLASHRCPGAGFLLVSGGMEMNFTYEAMLESSRINLEAEAAGILFD